MAKKIVSPSNTRTSYWHKVTAGRRLAIVLKPTSNSIIRGSDSKAFRAELISPTTRSKVGPLASARVRTCSQKRSASATELPGPGAVVSFRSRIAASTSMPSLPSRAFRYAASVSPSATRKQGWPDFKPSRRKGIVSRRRPSSRNRSRVAFATVVHPWGINSPR